MESRKIETESRRVQMWFWTHSDRFDQMCVCISAYPDAPDVSPVIIMCFSFISPAAQEEEEHFSWCLRHPVWPLTHAEAGPEQTTDTQDEGPEEEERRGAGRERVTQNTPNREWRLTHWQDSVWYQTSDASDFLYRPCLCSISPSSRTNTITWPAAASTGNIMEMWCNKQIFPDRSCVCGL